MKLLYIFTAFPLCRIFIFDIQYNDFLDVHKPSEGWSDSCENHDKSSNFKDLAAARTCAIMKDNAHFYPNCDFIASTATQICERALTVILVGRAAEALIARREGSIR